MLTQEQCKFLQESECAYQQSFYGNCEECPIYNLFNRSGHCAFYLYDGQWNLRVQELLIKLQEDWPLPPYLASR